WWRHGIGTKFSADRIVDRSGSFLRDFDVHTGQNRSTLIFDGTVDGSCCLGLRENRPGNRRNDQPDEDGPKKASPGKLHRVSSPKGKTSCLLCCVKNECLPIYSDMPQKQSET